MTPVCRVWAAANLLGIISLWGVQPAAAQLFPSHFELSGSVHLDEVDGTARAHLERVKAFVADEQWDEAVETLRQVTENYGGKVIAQTDRRYINVADYCHSLVAALPEPALVLYQQRVDALAEKWYRDGIEKHDRASLANVVNQLFCSSWGDDALLALGEMALEQGEYSVARGAWEKIVERPPERVATADFAAALKAAGEDTDAGKQIAKWYLPDAKQSPTYYRLRHDEYLSDEDAQALLQFWKDARLPPTRLAYPHSMLDAAAVRARLVLVSILEGSLDRARSELEAFEHLHPKASGKLAGREVEFAAELRAMLAAAEKWPTAQPRDDWPTFTGAPTRNHVAPKAIDVAGLAWEPIKLGAPIVASVDNSRVYSPRRVAEDAQGLLSYYPVVTGDLLLFNNQSDIWAFHLQSGKPAWPGDAKKPPGVFFSSEFVAVNPPSRGARGLGVPRFTMTCADNRLYARMGSQVTTRPVESFDTQTGNLVCLDLAAQGRLVWKIAPDDDKWAFEGAPLVEGADVYVAMRHSDVRPQAYVACFDSETGRRRWRTLVCSAETPGGGQAEEMTHNLLTLAEGSLYLNTNLGAVAALRAYDGQVQWITTYPRAKRSSSDGADMRAAHFSRDLTPCVFHRGLLLVAPSDSQSVFALDAVSGLMLWSSHLAEDAVHLLGVGGGNLLASGDRLWWIDATTGKVVRRWPESTPLGYGRGVLAGDKVYWPSREAIHIFSQKPPASGDDHRELPLAPLHLTGGNLTMVDGLLIVTTSDRIVALGQHGGKLPAEEPQSVSKK